MLSALHRGDDHLDEQQPSPSHHQSSYTSPRNSDALHRSASASALNGAGGRRFTAIDDHTWTYVRDNLGITTEIMGYGNIPIPSYRCIARMSPDSTISIRCITWNINEKILNTLCESLKHGKLEDIVTFSLQELPSSSRNFHEEAMQILSSVSDDHLVFISNRTWSQMIIVLIRKVHIKYATEPSIKFVPSALISKPIRTKGGIGICFRFYQRWIVVVGCHFSHENANQRIQDFQKIKRNMSFPTLQRFTNVEDMFAADIVIWTGDLNFRLTQNFDINWQQSSHSLQADIRKCVEVDELELLRRKKIAFTEFKEAVINFPPSYKFKIGTDSYSDKRVPSYTDRILYRCNNNIATKVMAYDIVRGASQSDHKPVYCTFNLNVTDKPIPQRYLSQMK